MIFSSLLLGVVGQVRDEPLLSLFERHPLAFGVVGGLVAPDLSNAEVAGVRVGEVEAADGYQITRPRAA